MSEKVLIFVPCLDGVQVDHVSAMMATCEDLASRGLQAEIDYYVGDAMICRARNAMSATFLASDADAMLMIDSDIVIPPHALAQLLGANAHVIGFNCRHRVPSERWASQSEDHEAPLSKAKHLGTGVMLVRRSALEALVRRKEEQADFNLERYRDAHGRWVWGFFVPFVQRSPERKYLSEDWAFCARLEAAGVDVFIDNTIRPKHIGRQFY